MAMLAMTILVHFWVKGQQKKKSRKRGGEGEVIN
jgi:hypothetical protein